MAAVADDIIAAPLAVIGSIGVIAQLPNFNRFLNKNNVDFEQITAGRYKRTLSLLGKNTEEGRRKMQQEVDETLTLFKAHIQKYRPHVDIETVATGEHWYGEQALDLKLVDQLQTSDEFLLDALANKDIIQLNYCATKGILSKLKQSSSQLYHRYLSQYGCDFLNH